MKDETPMSEPYGVYVPLINPNEPEARLSGLGVVEGQRVGVGDVLCNLETTKSVVEVVAEREGFIVGLRVTVGDMLRAGELLCWLVETAEWQPPEIGEAKSHEELTSPTGLRITKPAMELVSEESIDLSMLPIGPIITREMIRQILEQERSTQLDSLPGPFGDKDIILYGAGGHGKSLIDLLQELGTYALIGVIDDKLEIGSQVMGVPVIGSGGVLHVLVERGLRLAVNAVGGVGDIMSRIGVFHRIMEAGCTCPTLLHPTAIVEYSAQLADGVQVFPQAYIGSESRIDFGVIVNTSAVVSHDCHIEAYANVAPGALLAGGVTLGEGVLVGMGVSINLNVTVGERTRIGNNAVVKRDVPPKAIIPAGSIWPP